MTDMNLLRALIHTKRLTASQEKAFRQMLQDMVDGKLVSMTRGQKDWVEKVFNDLNLSGKALELAPMPKPRPTRFGAAPTIFEQPKPLKPPGRA